MKISEGDGNIYILLYLKYLSKTTATRILFSYVTAAVCALALGITIAFTGVLEGFNQLTTTTASTPSSADHANSHTPRFLNAEASTMPMLAIDYAVLDVERDGDASAGPLVVKVYPDWLDRHCESCYRIDYNAYLVGKAGIAWKTGQPLDVQGAQRMVVWAKGEYGGEQVRFLILGKQIGSPSSTTDENLFDNIEFVSKSETVTLSSNFQMYHIDIPNVDTTNFNDITHLVAVEIEGGDRARPTVIYLSGFIFDSSTPSNQYVLENEEIAS